jgi:hypothetical protein
MMADTETAQHTRTLLHLETWQKECDRHEAELAPILDPYLEKRSRQMKDPVLDFLFEYFPFRPSHLRRWSPGIGVELEITPDATLPEISELVTDGSRARLNPDFFPEKRISSIRWILGLLKESRNKKPFFGCFGMHEWAMVYRTEEVRHEQIPLRLSDDEIAAFVESRPLLCTHFDAFRFFTKKARPMNRHNLSRERFREMEQPGCVHTNMDLYKWAFKLYPWISGDLIRRAFLNAVEARRVDMQASPYDVTEFGLEPIKIETEAGRKEYLDQQTEIYRSSAPIRQELIEAYEQVLQVVG